MPRPIKVKVQAVGFEESLRQSVRNVERGGVGKVNLQGSKKSIESLEQPLGRITGQADEFTKSMEASNARVLAFGASVGIIGAVANAFRELVSATIQVEAQLKEIETILQGPGFNAENFEALGEAIFDVARNTANSFEVTGKAALELSRQGLEASEVAKRLSDSLILARLSGLEATEAVLGLTAAVNSFSASGITTAEVLNKIAAAAKSAAVSDKDLIDGLKRSGSVAVATGVQFDELIGVIAALQERTARGGAVIGNSLKTIFTRIQSAENIRTLEDLGVDVVDLNGNLLSSLKIVQNVANELKTLPKGERLNIAEGLVGKFQIAPFLALLEDLQQEQSRSGEITVESLKAANEAYKRNAELNKTLSAIIQQTLVDLTQLGKTIGNLGVLDPLKDLFEFIGATTGFFQDLLGEEEGEGIGSKMGKGIVKGLSAAIFGIPGLALIGGILITLAGNLIKFTGKSVRTFFQMNAAARDLSNTESLIAQNLLTNVNLQQKLLSLEGNRVAQARVLGDAFARQLNLVQQVKTFAATNAAGVVRFRDEKLIVGARPSAASGYVPSAVSAERKDIQKGVGGARPSDKPVVIPNFNFGGGRKGTMVAHTGEYIVPNYGGGSGTAVYNRNMAQKMGLPSGAKKINASGGFVPNFASATTGQPRLGSAALLPVKQQGRTSIPSGMKGVRDRHITLVSRKALETLTPEEKDRVKVAMNIIPPPVAVNYDESFVASRSAKGGKPAKRSSGFTIKEQDSLRQYVNAIFAKANVPNPEPNRLFHVSTSAQPVEGMPFKFAPVGDVNKKDVRRFADGYTPNFARAQGEKLGGGYYGDFFALKGDKGVKRFKDHTSQEAIEHEYRISQELHKRLRSVPHLDSPKVIGTLERSLKARRVGKQVVSFPIAKTAMGTFVAANFGVGVEKEILKHAGLYIEDMTGENYAVNSSGAKVVKEIPELDKVLHDDEVRSALPQAMESFKQAKGKAIILDAGGFDPRAAEGFVPNYAIRKDLKIQDLQRVQALGGSTGAELVRDSKAGQQLVLKRGANQKQVFVEARANRLFKTLGQAVPDIRLIRGEDGKSRALVSEFITGQELGQFLKTASPDQIAQVKQSIAQGFAATALLADRDFAGLNNDNMLVDKKLRPVRIDVGASLDMRAMGSKKEFGSNVSEYGGFLQRKPEFFGGLSQEDIRAQVSEIEKRQPELLKQGGKYKGVLGERIKDLRRQSGASGFVPSSPLTLGSSRYPTERAHDKVSEIFRGIRFERAKAARSPVDKGLLGARRGSTGNTIYDQVTNLGSSSGGGLQPASPDFRVATIFAHGAGTLSLEDDIDRALRDLVTLPLKGGERDVFALQSLKAKWNALNSASFTPAGQLSQRLANRKSIQQKINNILRVRVPAGGLVGAVISKRIDDSRLIAPDQDYGFGNARDFTKETKQKVKDEAFRGSNLGKEPTLIDLRKVGNFQAESEIRVLGNFGRIDRAWGVASKHSLNYNNELTDPRLLDKGAAGFIPNFATESEILAAFNRLDTSGVNASQIESTIRNNSSAVDYLSGLPSGDATERGLQEVIENLTGEIIPIKGASSSSATKTTTPDKMTKYQSMAGRIGAILNPPTLKIDLLSGGGRKKNASRGLVSIINSGLINEINAGQVIGPQVPKLLASVKTARARGIIKPDVPPIRIHGDLSVDRIYKELQQGVAGKSLSMGDLYGRAAKKIVRKTNRELDGHLKTLGIPVKGQPGYKVYAGFDFTAADGFIPNFVGGAEEAPENVFANRLVTDPRYQSELRKQAKANPDAKADNAFAEQFLREKFNVEGTARVAADFYPEKELNLKQVRNRLSSKLTAIRKGPKAAGAKVALAGVEKQKELTRDVLAGAKKIPINTLELGGIGGVAVNAGPDISNINDQEFQLSALRPGIVAKLRDERPAFKEILTDRDKLIFKNMKKGPVPTFTKEGEEGRIELADAVGEAVTPALVSLASRINRPFTSQAPQVTKELGKVRGAGRSLVPAESQGQIIEAAAKLFLNTVNEVSGAFESKDQGRPFDFTNAKLNEDGLNMPYQYVDIKRNVAALGGTSDGTLVNKYLQVADSDKNARTRLGIEIANNLKNAIPIKRNSPTEKAVKGFIPNYVFGKTYKVNTSQDDRDIAKSKSAFRAIESPLGSGEGPYVEKDFYGKRRTRGRIATINDQMYQIMAQDMHGGLYTDLSFKPISKGNPFKDTDYNAFTKMTGTGGFSTLKAVVQQIKKIPNLQKHLLMTGSNFKRTRVYAKMLKRAGVPFNVEFDDNEAYNDDGFMFQGLADEIGGTDPKEFVMGKKGMALDESLADDASEAMKIVIDRDKLFKMGSRGFIPNFSDPLGAAIKREISAGVSKNQIYIDNSPRLKSPLNPRGLAVANRRDEPVGVFQGVNRSVRQGLDPQEAGAANGFVPNFVIRNPLGANPENLQGLENLTREQALKKVEDERIARIKQLNDVYQKRILRLNKIQKAQEAQVIKLAADRDAAAEGTAKRKRLNKELEEAILKTNKANDLMQQNIRKRDTLGKALDKQVAATNKDIRIATGGVLGQITQGRTGSKNALGRERTISPKATVPTGSRDLLGTLFAVQAGLTGLSGAIGDTDSAFGRISKGVLVDIPQTISTALFAVEGFGQLANNAKGGLGKFVGKLGVYGFVIGGVIGTLKQLNTIYEDASGITDKLNTSFGKLSDAADKVTVSLGKEQQALVRKETKEAVGRITGGEGLFKFSRGSSKLAKEEGVILSVDSKRLTEGFQQAISKGINPEAFERALVETATPVEGGAFTRVSKEPLPFFNRGEGERVQLRYITTDSVDKAIDTVGQLLRDSLQLEEIVAKFDFSEIKITKSLGSKFTLEDKIIESTEDEIKSLLGSPFRADFDKLKKEISDQLGDSIDLSGPAGQERLLQAVLKVRSQLVKTQDEEDKLLKSINRKYENRLKVLDATAAIRAAEAAARAASAQNEITQIEDISAIERDRLITEIERSKQSKIRQGELANEKAGIEANVKAFRELADNIKKSIDEAPGFTLDQLKDSVTTISKDLENLPAEKFEKIQRFLEEGIGTAESSGVKEVVKDLNTLLLSKGITKPVLQNVPSEAILDLAVALAKGNQLRKEELDLIIRSANAEAIAAKAKDRTTQAAERQIRVSERRLDAERQLRRLQFEQLTPVEEINRDQRIELTIEPIFNTRASSLNREIAKLQNDIQTAFSEGGREARGIQLDILEQTGDDILAELDKRLSKASPDERDTRLEEARVILGSLSTFEELRVKYGKEYHDIITQNADIQKQTLTNAQKEALERLITAEKELALKKQIQKESSGPLGEFGGGLIQGLRTLQEQTANYSYELGEQLPDEFASNMSEAMDKIILQGEAFGATMRDAAVSFLNAFNQQQFKQIARLLTGGIKDPETGKEDGGIFQAIFGRFFKANSGGRVRGGTGQKDDVPALLTGGEFVINKQAVGKYGMPFFDSLNKGRVPQFQDGGFFAPGLYNQDTITGKEDLLNFATQTVTSGRNDVIGGGEGLAFVGIEPESGRLTTEGRKRGAPIQRATQDAKGQAFDLFVQQNKAEEALREQERESKKALRRQLIGAGIGIAAQFALGRFAQGFEFGTLGEGSFGEGVGAGFKNLINPIGKAIPLEYLAAPVTSSSFSAASDFAGTATRGVFTPNLPPIGNSGLAGKTMLPSLNPIPTIAPSLPSRYATPLSIDPVSGEPFGVELIRTWADFGQGFNLKTGQLEPIRRATGGLMPPSTGVDTIPAMLSGGEYVMNRASTQRVGAGNLQAMNAGADSIVTEEVSERQSDELVAKLDELISAVVENASGTINITVNSEGGVSQEESKDPSSSDRNLAQKIKDVVVRVIEDQKRLGGTLRRGI